MTQGVQPLPQQADGEGVRGRGNIPKKIETFTTAFKALKDFYLQVWIFQSGFYSTFLNTRSEKNVQAILTLLLEILYLLKLSTLNNWYSETQHTSELSII